MYLVVTRSFPPELGGMQSLMWGLSKELSKNYLIKVFADYQDGIKNLMKTLTFQLKELVE
jgi:phosphatidylinositol alpha-1,6-mannosyltransferase